MILPNIAGYWLFCTVKKPVELVGCTRYASLSALLFSSYEKDLATKSRWIINNLLDVLVRSIVEYFYSLIVI